MNSKHTLDTISLQLPKYLNPNFEIDAKERTSNRNPLALLEETCKNIGKDDTESKTTCSSSVSKTLPLLIDTRDDLHKSFDNFSSNLSRKRPLSNSTASPISNVSSNLSSSLSKRNKRNSPSPNFSSPPHKLPTTDISAAAGVKSTTSQIPLKENESFASIYQQLMNSRTNHHDSHLPNYTPQTTMTDSQMIYLRHLHSVLSRSQCQLSSNSLTQLPTSTCSCYSCQFHYSQPPFYNRLLIDQTAASSSTTLQKSNNNQMEPKFCIFCGKHQPNSSELLAHLKSHVNESPVNKKDHVVTTPLNPTHQFPLKFNSIDYLPHNNYLAQTPFVKSVAPPIDPFVNQYINYLNSGLNSLYSSAYV